MAAWQAVKSWLRHRSRLQQHSSYSHDEHIATLEGGGALSAATETRYHQRREQCRTCGSKTLAGKTGLKRERKGHKVTRC